MNDTRNDISQSHTQSGGKARIRKTVYLLVGGIATTIAAAIIGIITTAYVEISFKNLSLNNIADPRQWMDFHVDLVKPETFRGYYGDNDDGRSVLRDAQFSLRFFELTKKSPW